MLARAIQLKALIRSTLKRKGNPAGNPLPKWRGAFLNIDFQS
jgi:hypothetical protein